MLESGYNDFLSFISLFDVTEVIVISVNMLLMIFARRIMRAIYHEPESSSNFKFRVNIFRVFNLLIIIAFTYYHLYSAQSTKGLGYKIVAISVILYLSYAALHFASFLIRRRYGEHVRLKVLARRLRHIIHACSVFLPLH